MGHTTAQHTFCPIPSGHIRSAVWVSDRHDHKFFPIFFLKQVGLAPVATNFVMAATPLAVAAVAAGSPQLANLIGEMAAGSYAELAVSSPCTLLYHAHHHAQNPLMWMVNTSKDTVNCMILA